MIKPDCNLPLPDSSAQLHSDRLLTVIRDRLLAAGGKMTFAEYMQLCLYHPGLGYYSAGLPKLGATGDFVTAPEISPLFSMAVARHIADVLQQQGGDCLEFGAGSGKMAGDILLQLDRDHCLPNHYFIIETSADLRQRQQQYLAAKLGALFDKVIWLDHLPASLTGVIIANEVCDAMPVHSLMLDHDKAFERYVVWQQTQLEWQLFELSEQRLVDQANWMRPQIHHQPFLTEVNLYAPAWLSSLSKTLGQGAILILDYGHPASQFFAAGRAQGGIRCHYQHHVHDDPFWLPGLQDVTSHINFTALAEAATAADLQVAGFQKQADFLLSGDILSLAEKSTPSELAQLQQSAALKRLLLPDQMGEIFKVMTLTKNISSPVVRCQPGDLRHQL